MNDSSRKASGSTSGGGSRGGCAVAVAIAFVFFVIVYWATDGFGGDDAEFYSDETDRYSEYQTYLGNPIPRFTPNDSRSLSNALAESERRHGVCFGWKLTDGSEDAEQDYGADDSVSDTDPASSFDQGSSRGPNVAAETCSRWVEVRVTVAYTSASSENWSGVELDVAASDDFANSKLPDLDEFAELGITAERIIDAPVQSTGHAALSLPLLLTQSGALNEPAGGGNPQESKPAKPLPPAEGEGSLAWFWIALLGVVTLVAAGLGIAGAVRRGSDGSGPSGPPGGGQGPPPPPGPPPQGPQGPGGQGPPPGYPPQGQPPPGQPHPGQPPQAHFQPGAHGVPYRGGPPQGQPPPHPQQGYPQQGHFQQGHPPQGPGPAQH